MIESRLDDYEPDYKNWEQYLNLRNINAIDYADPVGTKTAELNQTPLEKHSQASSDRRLPNQQ